MNQRVRSDHPGTELCSNPGRCPAESAVMSGADLCLSADGRRVWQILLITARPACPPPEYGCRRQTAGSLLLSAASPDRGATGSGCRRQTAVNPRRGSFDRTGNWLHSLRLIVFILQSGRSTILPLPLPLSGLLPCPFCSEFYFCVLRLVCPSGLRIFRPWTLRLLQSRSF